MGFWHNVVAPSMLSLSLNGSLIRGGSRPFTAVPTECDT